MSSTVSKVLAGYQTNCKMCKYFPQGWLAKPGKSKRLQIDKDNPKKQWFNVGFQFAGSSVVAGLIANEMSVSTLENIAIVMSVALFNAIAIRKPQHGELGRIPGSWRYHNTSKCKCCARMKKRETRYKSNRTGKKYKIEGDHTCQTSHCVYLVTCGLCQVQYVGQTTKSAMERHYGHRQEVKRGDGGLGAHFHQHADELGVDLEENMEGIMKHFHLTIIGSVEPDQPLSKCKLDNLEAEMIKKLKTMEVDGGLNLKTEKTTVCKAKKTRIRTVILYITFISSLAFLSLLGVYSSVL